MSPCIFDDPDTRKRTPLIHGSSFQSRIGLTIDGIHIQLDEHTRLLSDLVSSQSDLRGLLRFQTSTNEPTQFGAEQTGLRANSLASFTGDQSSNSVISISGYTGGYQRAPCRCGCSCTCHNSYRSKSLQVLIGALGVLYVGYSGNPLGRGCTVLECQARTTLRAYVRYLFPSWFLSRMLTLSVVTAISHEITVSLNIRRIVSNFESYRLISREDIEGLKNLFQRGLASPNDLDIRGASFLIVSYLVLYFTDL